MLFSMLGCTALFAHPRIMSIIIIAGLGCSLVLDCELVNGLLCYAAVPHSLCVYNSYRKDQKSCRKAHCQLLFWEGQLRSCSKAFVTGISNSWQLKLGQIFNFSLHYEFKKWILHHVCSTFFGIKVRHFNPIPTQALLCDISKSIHFETVSFRFIKIRSYSSCKQGLAWKGLMKRTLFTLRQDHPDMVLNNERTLSWLWKRILAWGNRVNLEDVMLVNSD